MIRIKLKRYAFLYSIVMFISITSRAQLPFYNSGEFLPSGTDLHFIDNNPWDDGWVKVFEENFDVNASYPNFSYYEANKWTINEGYADGQNPGVPIYMFKKQNVRMDNGYCYIKAQKESSSWPATNPLHYYDYTSGGIETNMLNNPRQEWETGRFEVRMKMSKAYWGHDNMWIFAGLQGEIDANEFERDKNWAPHHWHRIQPGPVYSCNDKTFIFPPAHISFHVYTVIWDKYFIYIIVDGNINNMKFIPKVLPPLGSSNWNNLLPGMYMLQNCFMPINQAGHVILDQRIDNKFFMENGHRKWGDLLSRLTSQKSGMPGETVIDWIKIYQRNPCSQDHIITSPTLFPYERLNEKSVIVGTNALGMVGNPWHNIAPGWGGGKYEGEHVTIRDNFEFYPVPAPNDPSKFTSFEFIAKDCPENKGENNEYEIPEYNSSIVDEDTFSCEEDIDYLVVDSLIDSAIVTEDTAFLEEIYAVLDSLGCPHEIGNKSSNSNIRKAKIEDAMIAVGSELESKPAIRIYPNPNNGSFTIALPIAAECDVSVTNALGVEVYKTKIKKDLRTSIRLDNVPSGTYTIHINGPGINYKEKLTIIK